MRIRFSDISTVLTAAEVNAATTKASNLWTNKLMGMQSTLVEKISDKQKMVDNGQTRSAFSVICSKTPYAREDPLVTVPRSPKSEKYTKT